MILTIPNLLQGKALMHQLSVESGTAGKAGLLRASGGRAGVRLSYFRARAIHSSYAANMYLDLDAIDPDEGQYLVISSQLSTAHRNHRGCAG